MPQSRSRYQDDQGYNQGYDSQAEDFRPNYDSGDEEDGHRPHKQSSHRHHSSSSRVSGAGKKAADSVREGARDARRAWDQQSTGKKIGMGFLAAAAVGVAVKNRHEIEEGGRRVIESGKRTADRVRDDSDNGHRHRSRSSDRDRDRDRSRSRDRRPRKREHD